MSGRVSGSSFTPSQRDMKEPIRQSGDERRIPGLAGSSSSARAYFTRSRRSSG